MTDRVGGGFDALGQLPKEWTRGQVTSDFSLLGLFSKAADLSATAHLRLLKTSHQRVISSRPETPPAAFSSQAYAATTPSPKPRVPRSLWPMRRSQPLFTEFLAWAPNRYP